MADQATENDVDIYALDTWVGALDQIRKKQYWTGITTLGGATYWKSKEGSDTRTLKAMKPKSPWDKAYYYEHESKERDLEEGEEPVEHNRVEKTYNALWEAASKSFPDDVITEDGKPLLDKDGKPQTLADEVETAMYFCTKIMMKSRSPFVNAMYTWMMQEAKNHSEVTGIKNRNPFHPDYYKDEATGEPLHQYGIRAKLLEGLGKAVLESARKQGLKGGSWGFDLCDKDGAGNPKPKYQIKHSDGEYHDIDADELQQLLNQENGPHVVMTANHAFLENKTIDLDSITGGVEKLLKKAVSNGEENPNLHIKGYDESPGAGDTVMVSAIYSRENNVLNLAHLFRRLDKIKQHHQEGKASEDDLTDVSPASLMLASTVLKTILKDPDSVASIDDDPAFLEVGEEGREKQPKLLKDGTHAFHPDAAERLRHLVQVGFSQGGNVMRDALRYVVHEIHEAQIDCPAGKTKQAAAKEILSSLSVTAISLNEVEMNDFYINYGVNCGRISNAYERRDLGGFIAVPDETPHTTSDTNIIFKAFKDSNGHHPGMMFDAIINKGEDGNDARALSYFECAFAPNVQKVALRMLRREGDDLLFELSGRSKDANIESAVDVIQGALATEGVTSASITRDDERTEVGRRQYRLTLDGLNGEEKTSVLDKVRAALEASDEKVVVSDDVLRGINIAKRSEAEFDIPKAVEAEHRFENISSLDPFNRVNASQIEAVESMLAKDPIKQAR